LRLIIGTECGSVIFLDEQTTKQTRTMRKKRSTQKGDDSNGGEGIQGNPSQQQEAVGTPFLPEQMDEATITVGDMIRAMQYLTEEVTNLRYKLLQYELCQTKSKK